MTRMGHIFSSVGQSVGICALLLLGLIGEVAGQSRGKVMKQAEKELRQANFPTAETLYRQLVERDQNDKAARLGMSFAQIKQNRLLEAYQNAAQVLAVEPLNARAHSLLGTALLRSGDFRTSIESLYTAVRLNDREALAIAGLSDVEYFENRTRNAYAGLRRAVQLEPNEPDFYISLARTCSRLEYYDEAADAFERFLEVSPKTDAERRARIKGLIDFYRYLGTTRIHRTGGRELTTIPFEIVNFRPMINVTINGKGPIRLIIDTGASLSVLSDRAAERLGIRPVARGGNARAIGGDGTFPIIYGLLDSLVIGEAKIEMVPVYIRTVYSSPDIPEAERADGYLGLSILANFAMTLDYKARELTLDRTPLPPEPPLPVSPVSNDTPPASGRGTETPVQLAVPFAGETVRQSVAPRALADGYEVPIRSTSGGLVSTETNLPGIDRPLNFIIDTGASTSVISKAAVKSYQLENLILPGVKVRVIGAAGIADDTAALGINTLTVNGLRKNRSRALILDLGSVNETSGFEQHGVLGGDYLSHFRVVFDLRRYQFKLTPQTAAISVAATEQPEQGGK
jgi:tetratricopeptide (TPR) repeat protein